MVYKLFEATPNNRLQPDLESVRNWALLTKITLRDGVADPENRINHHQSRLEILRIAHLPMDRKKNGDKFPNLVQRCFLFSKFSDS